MKAVHFGAGNIGRGFIGQILYENNFEIQFVDVNAAIIECLNKDRMYKLTYAEDAGEQIIIQNVSGINSQESPDSVSEAITNCDIITVSVGPNVLKRIAATIYTGLKKRLSVGKGSPLDIIACENMINASSALKDYVYEYIQNKEEEQMFDRYFGFPDAAVDRIVPLNKKENTIDVIAERYHEWIIQKKGMVNPNLQLRGVHYVDELLPYIERKLFIINTGHSAAAYLGWWLGYQDITEAFHDPRIEEVFLQTNAQTKEYIISVWGFSISEIDDYRMKSLQRFKNPYVSDEISRVARTPMRKLGYEERFIRPIRMLKNLDKPYDYLVNICGYILNYKNDHDEEACRMRKLFMESVPEHVIEVITGINDEKLIMELTNSYIEKKEKLNEIKTTDCTG